MKHFALALLLALTAVTLTATSPQQSAHAQASIQLRPVIIIRFNQPRVNYQQQLSMVIKRAKDIKPDVVFDVIQYIPDTQSRSLIAQYDYNQSRLVRSMLSAGVNQSHLNVMREATTDVTTDEIYIFVR